MGWLQWLKWILLTRAHPGTAVSKCPNFSDRFDTELLIWKYILSGPTSSLFTSWLYQALPPRTWPPLPSTGSRSNNLLGLTKSKGSWCFIEVTVLTFLVLHFCPFFFFFGYQWVLSSIDVGYRFILYLDNNTPLSVFTTYLWVQPSSLFIQSCWSYSNCCLLYSGILVLPPGLYYFMVASP